MVFRILHFVYSLLMPFFSYWLWPNPAGWYYADTRVVVLLVIAIALVVASFILSRIRAGVQNPVTRKLMSGWPTASVWFGLTLLVLVVSRVEMIQFLAMRALLGVWFLLFVLYALFQFVQFRRRHYTVLERTHIIDERDKYLPKRKR